MSAPTLETEAPRPLSAEGLFEFWLRHSNEFMAWQQQNLILREPTREELAKHSKRLDLMLGYETKCFMSTQASTKIYRNPHKRPCGHVTEARLEPGAVLVFAPETKRTSLS